jgi:hypothetical protein
MLTEYFFWFTQPSAVLNSYDWLFAYIFAGLFLLSIIMWFMKKFLINHEITKKIFAKFANAAFWMGLVGLVWFGFRYQTVPIFSRRVFVGLIIILAVIWIGWVMRYALFKYSQEKKDYDYVQIKNKYIK